MTDNFYREQLMEIYKNPTHLGTLTKPTVQVHEVNPMCGDEITLHLNIKDDKIIDAKFAGAACAVSIVSSELLLEDIKGKTLEEAKQLTKEELLKLIGITLTTSRVRCATLSLEALTNAIRNYENF